MKTLKYVFLFVTFWRGFFFLKKKSKTQKTKNGNLQVVAAASVRSEGRLGQMCLES